MTVGVSEKEKERKGESERERERERERESEVIEHFQCIHVQGVLKERDRNAFLSARSVTEYATSDIPHLITS